MKQVYFREQRIKIYSQISCLYMMMKTCDNLWCFNFINKKKLHSGGLPASIFIYVGAKKKPYRRLGSVGPQKKAENFPIPWWPGGILRVVGGMGSLEI